MWICEFHNKTSVNATYINLLLGLQAYASRSMDRLMPLGTQVYRAPMGENPNESHAVRDLSEKPTPVTCRVNKSLHSEPCLCVLSQFTGTLCAAVREECGVAPWCLHRFAEKGFNAKCQHPRPIVNTLAYTGSIRQCPTCIISLFYRDCASGRCWNMCTYPRLHLWSTFVAVLRYFPWGYFMLLLLLPSWISNTASSPALAEAAGLREIIDF